MNATRQSILLRPRTTAMRCPQLTTLRKTQTIMITRPDYVAKPHGRLFRTFQLLDHRVPFIVDTGATETFLSSTIAESLLSDTTAFQC
jgi:predicted aspartyl protease